MDSLGVVGRLAVVALLIPILTFHALTFVYMFSIVNPENKDQYPITLLIPDASVQQTSKPPDPNLSVGPNDGDDGRILALTNREINVFNKQTGDNLYSDSYSNFFLPGIRDGNGGFDPYTIWDVFRKRFYFLTWDVVPPLANVTIDVPSPVSGDYPAETGQFSSPVGVSGTIVAASPLNACSALTNAASILGNIAFIRRGTCTFAAKTINAFNAGAIGVIIGNNANTGLTFMAGTTPGVNISAVFMLKSDFDAILPYLPTNGSISLPADPQLNRNLFWTATSKDTQPSAKSDFHIYPYNSIFTGNQAETDFPKIATGPKAMFVTDVDFNGPLDADFAGIRITAFDADDMANGIGATVLWSSIVTPSDISEVFFPARFARVEDGQLYPNYFVSLNADANAPPFNFTVALRLVIIWADETGLDPAMVTLTLPEPMPVCNGEGAGDCELLGRQPFPLPFNNQLDLLAGYPLTCVMSKGFIYTAAVKHNTIALPSTGHSSIVWFKIDVRTTNTTHTASIVDFGNLDLGKNFDLGYPAIDVDQFDNMLINFQVSGPTLPQSFAVIGRKANDPPGTLRYPPKLVARGSFSYFAGTEPGRQGDYTGLQADPDCFTEPQPPGRPKCGFFGIGQHPLDGSFEEPGLLDTWSTTIYRAEFHHRRGNA